MRRLTAAFLIALAVLIVIHHSYRLVPSSWCEGLRTFTTLSSTYTNDKNQGVWVRYTFECFDEGEHIINATSVRFIPDDNPTIRDRPFVPPRTLEESNQHIIQQATQLLARHPPALPLIPNALANPHENVRVEYPERQLVASLMSIRSHVTFNRDTGGLYVLTFAVWFGILANSWRHWFFQAIPHACPACGYDLKGIDPSAVCPECGSPRNAKP